MNRRDFLKSLAVFFAATQLPTPKVAEVIAQLPPIDWASWNHVGLIHDAYSGTMKMMINDIDYSSDQEAKDIVCKFINIGKDGSKLLIGSPDWNATYHTANDTEEIVKVDFDMKCGNSSPAPLADAYAYHPVLIDDVALVLEKKDKNG